MKDQKIIKAIFNRFYTTVDKAQALTGYLPGLCFAAVMVRYFAGADIISSSLNQIS